MFPISLPPSTFLYSCFFEYLGEKKKKQKSLSAVLHSLFLQLDVQSILTVSWEDSWAVCLLPGCL